MKFLFASDSFKGTLSSERITQLLEEAAGRTFPGCETAGVPAVSYTHLDVYKRQVWYMPWNRANS